jgi:protein-tyrosine phosphatase
MDTCSYFIENKALFGSMPNNETVKDLENIGVVFFVNLTSLRDRLVTFYETTHTVIKYPILDRKTPNDMLSFSKFIYKLYITIKTLKGNQKIYIHCKGGHGRSGIVVASILCLFHKIPPEYGLELTKVYHQKRKNMRDKWRRIGSPQTFNQKDFVRRLFDPLCFTFFSQCFLSNGSPHSITVPGVGSFKNVEAAYQAHKNLENEDYVKLLQEEDDLIRIRELGKTTSLCVHWDDQKHNIMYSLVKLKFDTYPELKSNLLYTFLRPIVLNSKEKTYWKDLECNRFGKLLQKIRNDYYLFENEDEN